MLAPQIVLETAKRQGKKMTTSVAGLEHFGIKLSDASKVFGKKVRDAFNPSLPHVNGIAAVR